MPIISTETHHQEPQPTVMGVSVDAWSRFITKVGVPSAIAIGAIVFFGWLFSGAVQRTENALNAHIIENSQVGHKLDRLLIYQPLMMNMATQQCVNASRTESARAACFATAAGAAPR